MVEVHTTFRGCAARPAVVSRPGLWARLWASARVTVVSAPPGSGKTVLLRSWISKAGLGERAAWVSAGRDERDPQPFWLSVLDALRQTVPGSALVRLLTAAPDLDGWAIVERLLKDLAPLDQQLWLVIAGRRRCRKAGAGRRRPAQVLLGVVRLLLARRALGVPVAPCAGAARAPGRPPHVHSSYANGGRNHAATPHHSALL